MEIPWEARSVPWRVNFPGFWPRIRITLGDSLVLDGGDIKKYFLHVWDWDELFGHGDWFGCGWDRGGCQ